MLENREAGRFGGAAPKFWGKKASTYLASTEKYALATEAQKNGKKHRGV
jgi:hypothetical protein